MLSNRSFFSLACRSSSSLLRIIGPDEGAIGTLVLEEALEILETLDFVSSAPPSL
jgi:hypothetical protein